MNNEILRQSVSVGVGALSLGVAAVLWLLVRGKTKKPRIEAWMDRAIILLVLAGAVGLAGTFVGTWTRRGIAGLNGLVTRWIGPALGPFVLIVFALILVVAVAVALWEANIGKRTLTATWLAPFTAGAIPGPVGAFALSGITALSGIAAAGIGGAFGIH